MRKITLFLLLLCIAGITNAQDILVKNDKTELKVKVLEITDAAIKYKKFEMQDGPTYSIAKAAVFMIMYQNGTKEYMENKQVVPIVKPTTPKPVNTVATVMKTNTVNTYQTSSSGRANTKKSNWGAQLSVLSTNASVGADITSGSVIRMRAGFYFKVPISKHLTLEPSINIVGKGAKMSYSDYSSFGTNEINTSFIEIPFSVVYTTNGNKGLMIGVAPTFSFRIAQSEKVVVTDYGSGGTYSYSGSPNLKSTELGAIVSVGYKFSSKFSLSVLYNKGFTNLSELGGTYTTNYFGINTSFGF